MRIRLRRGELAIIALTLMFACFIGGYFAGRKGAVNLVPVPSAEAGGETYRPVDPQEPAGSAGNSLNAVPGTGGGEQGGAAGGGAQGGQASENTADASSDGVREQPGALRDDDGKININTASRAELMDLSGIGQVLADRIVDYRTNNGSFSQIEDLMKVSGIGTKRFEAIRERITVG